MGALAPSCFETESLVKENWWGFRSADFNLNSLRKSAPFLLDEASGLAMTATVSVDSDVFQGSLKINK